MKTKFFINSILGREDLVQIKPSEIKDPSNEKKIKPNPVNKSSEIIPERQSDSTQQYLSSMMGDGPICSSCGHITIRSGSCYKCLNCGTSVGCS